MKTKLYLYGCALSTAVFLMTSGSVFSQCNCSGGAPATEIHNVQYMNPTTSSNYSLFFPKFDPSVGTLSCVKITATLQGQATTTVAVTQNADLFEWELTQIPQITLPGLSVNKTIRQEYGPDSMATQHWIDSVNAIRTIPTTAVPQKIYGPADLLVNAALYKQTNSPGIEYYTNLGTPVEVKFGITGGLLALAGSLNYTAGIATMTSGSFHLYYYWCPAGVLAKNIRNFTSQISNDNLQVEWTADNQSGNIQYEVQVSTDALNYKTVYTQPSQGVGGSSSAYQFLYNIPAGAGDRLYVRIKQTDPSGKVTYSSVNKVNLQGVDGTGTLGVYPNPAVDKVSLQFEQVMTGDFSIDIVSITGQRLFNRQIRINKSKTASVDLNNAPRSGMYYLRATDKRTGSVYVNKIFMK